ncbi:MAG: hypothetical protein HQ453_01145 [Actinobacteria bacterium]|nr:hypothetical protein [Actinomycetota bacterium]
MDEKSLAAELQQSKDDASEWGAVTTPSVPSTKRRLAAMVSIRLAPAELEMVQQRAREREMTVSAYLRKLALDDAGETFAPMGYHFLEIKAGTTAVWMGTTGTFTPQHGTQLRSSHS